MSLSWILIIPLYTYHTNILDRRRRTCQAIKVTVRQRWSQQLSYHAYLIKPCVHTYHTYHAMYDTYHRPAKPSVKGKGGANSEEAGSTKTS